MDNLQKQAVFDMLDKGGMVSKSKLSIDTIVIASSLFEFSTAVHRTCSGIPDDIFERMYRWINEQEFWNIQLLKWDISLSDNSVDDWRSEFDANTFDEMIINLANACCTVHKKNQVYQQLNKENSNEK